MARGRGQPTSYDASYPKQAEKLCRLGATDQEIADFFEVSIRTVYQWKSTHEEFSQALKAGKAEADERVERSLFQRATGYEVDAVKIFMPAGADKPVYAPYRERIVPDTTACIFWLKNRRPQDWRDKRELEITRPEAQLSDEELADALGKLDDLVATARATGSSKSTH